MTPAHAAEESQTLAAAARAYERLAAMDPPALESLIGELTRISDESSASAALLLTPEAQARADRNAQRAAGRATGAGVDRTGSSFGKSLTSGPTD